MDTNLTFPSETNAEGLYNIPNLPPGTYRVIVSKFAFRTIVKPDVELHVQDVISLNFSMEVGSVAESVTVEGARRSSRPRPARGGDFLSNEVRDLPLVGAESTFADAHSAGRHRGSGHLSFSDAVPSLRSR